MTTKEAVEQYLDSLHSVMFLDWDISKKDRREQCVDFLATFVGEINGRVEKGQETRV